MNEQHRKTVVALWQRVTDNHYTFMRENHALDPIKLQELHEAQKLHELAMANYMLQPALAFEVLKEMDDETYNLIPGDICAEIEIAFEDKHASKSPTGDVQPDQELRIQRYLRANSWLDQVARHYGLQPSALKRQPGQDDLLAPIHCQVDIQYCAAHTYMDDPRKAYFLYMGDMDRTNLDLIPREALVDMIEATR